MSSRSLILLLLVNINERSENLNPTFIIARQIVFELPNFALIDIPLKIYVLG